MVIRVIRGFIDLLPVLWCAGVAFFAGQLVTNHGLAAFHCGDPRTIGPWRIMTHVLVVATGELGDPVVELIRVKICNRLIQAPGFSGGVPGTGFLLWSVNSSDRRSAAPEWQPDQYPQGSGY